MSKITIIIIGIIVLCFGGLVTWSIISSQSKPTTNFDDYDSTSIIPPSDSNGQIGDHVRGNADSPVVFVEYADFQCPGCASIQPSISTLFEEYKDHVAFVFRNFPISGHQNARAAASAAGAAGLQGYFFEMADTLFSNQAVWIYASGGNRTDVFIDLFRKAAPNGDVNKFRTDMASPEISKKINFDYDLGVKKDKVTGTPTFLINGERIDITATTSMAILDLMREKLNAKLAEFNIIVSPNTDVDSD